MDMKNFIDLRIFSRENVIELEILIVQTPPNMQIVSMWVLVCWFETTMFMCLLDTSRKRRNIFYIDFYLW
jgi:hypothetical protein